jgi:NAD(P)H-dependent FMN reductase
VPTLQILIASTRPGRVGLPIAQWFERLAAAHGAFRLDVVDLAALALPFMDEPQHPRLRQYMHQHTRDWSARVEAADALVWVTPEYNHGLSAPLKNAIDYLHSEWQHKPVGFVSYGGVSAGLRSVAQLKQVAAALRIVPAVNAVSIPFAATFIDDEGEVQANETMENAARAMLDELVELELVLRPLRLGVRERAA